MKTIMQMGVLVCVLAVGAFRVQAQDRNAVMGYITSITADDQTYSKGLSKAERQFPVRVTLDSVQDTVLGFGEFDKTLVAQQAMFELLVKAMENRWQVTLRVRRETSSSRSHTRIVSVSARP